MPSGSSASEQQKRAYLPGMLDCTVRGVRVSASRTPAPTSRRCAPGGACFTDAGRPGSYYRIEGQKLWTSEAVWADWCLLLLRTESEGRPHQQLLDAPGTDVDAGAGVPAGPNGLRLQRIRRGLLHRSGRVGGSIAGPAGPGLGDRDGVAGLRTGPADMGWTARLQRFSPGPRAQIRDGSVRCDSVPARGPRSRVGGDGGAATSGAPQYQPAAGWQRARAGRLDRQVADDPRRTAAQSRAARPRRTRWRTEESELFQQYLWSRAQAIFGGSRQIQRDLVAQRVLGLPRPPS